MMNKLRQLIRAAELPAFNPLKTSSLNVTRWGSLFQVLYRYQKIREFLYHNWVWMRPMGWNRLLDQTDNWINGALNWEIWIQ